MYSKRIYTMSNDAGLGGRTGAGTSASCLGEVNWKTGGGIGNETVLGTGGIVDPCTGKCGKVLNSSLGLSTSGLYCELPLEDTNDLELESM